MEGARLAVQVRDERLERVVAVVLEQLAAVGADVEGFERGHGGGRVGIVGRGPAAVAEGAQEGGDGWQVGGHGLEARHDFCDDGDGAAIWGEVGHGLDAAADVVEEAGEGEFGGIPDWLEGFGDGTLQLAGPGFEV